MAQVEVNDFALWTKHIHGNEDLRRYLDSLEPDQTVKLRVDGKEGLWRKMSAYKRSGRRTPGLRPIGQSQVHWGSLYRRYKPEGGGLVDIELVDEHGGSSGAAGELPKRFEQASEAERRAAWEAFQALSKAGWRSEGPYGPRDELYDRDDK